MNFINGGAVLRIGIALVVVVSVISVPGSMVGTAAAASGGTIADVSVTGVTDADDDGRYSSFQVDITADTRVGEWGEFNVHPYFEIYVDDNLQTTTSKLPTGSDERFSYTLTITDLEASSADVTVKLRDKDIGSDRTYDTLTRRGALQIEPEEEDSTVRQQGLSGIRTLEESYTAAKHRLSLEHLQDEQVGHIDSAFGALVPTSEREVALDTSLTVLDDVADTSAGAIGSSLLAAPEVGINVWISLRKTRLANTLSKTDDATRDEFHDSLQDLIANTDQIQQRTPPDKTLETRLRDLEALYEDTKLYRSEVQNTYDDYQEYNPEALEIYEANRNSLAVIEGSFEQLEQTLIADYYFTQMALHPKRTPKNLTAVAGFRPPEYPDVTVTDLSVPERVSVGEQTTVSLTVKTQYASSPYQTITLGFPDADRLSDLSLADHTADDPKYAKLFSPGSEVWGNYTESKLTAEYPIAEVGTQAAAGETHTITATFTPERSGPVRIWAKSVTWADNSRGTLNTAPSWSAASRDDVVKDGQNEYAYTRTVSVAAPVQFDVAIRDTTSPVQAGEPLEVTATVRNTGGLRATKRVNLNIPGVGSDSQQVTLSGGESQTVSLSVNTQSGDSGSYTATVSSPDSQDSTSIRVSEQPDPANFKINSISTNSPVQAGNTLEIAAITKNTGDVQGTTLISLDIPGVGSDSRQVTLSGGESQTVSLSVNTQSGDSGSYTATVESPHDKASTSVTVGSQPPANEPPSPDFAYSPTDPHSGESISFRDQSSDPDGTIQSYEWTFGDGATSTQAAPTHTYTSSGTYTITLTVTDDDGEQRSTTRNITVTTHTSAAHTYRLPFTRNEQKLVSSLGSKLTVTARTTGTDVRIDHDSDGAFEQQTTLSDSESATISKPEAGSRVVSTDPVTVSYQYRSADYGAYEDDNQRYGVPEASLLGTEYYLPIDADQVSIMTTASTDVTVDADADGAAEHRRSLSANDVVSFTGVTSGTRITAGAPIHVVAERSDWGDMDNTYLVSLLPVGTANQTYHIPAEPAYNRDSSESKTSVYLAGTVDGTTVRTDQLGSTTPFELDAGEVERIQTTDSGTVHADHPIVAVYAYHVAATDPWTGDRREYIGVTTPVPHVRTNQGSWGGISEAVELWSTYDIAPGQPAPNEPPSPDFTHSPSAPQSGDPVSFTDQSSDPDGTIQSYEWTFGDGATSTQANPTHTYGNSGTYEVTLTVTDDDGKTRSTTQNISVSADKKAINTETLPAQEGLATHNRNIYAVNNSEIIKVDLSNDEAVNRFDAPDGLARGLAYGSGSLWFADGVGPHYDGEIVELDPTTGEVRSRISTSYDPRGLAYTDGSLWVADITANDIVEYSPDGEELSRFDVPTTSPRGLAAFDGSLWLGTMDAALYEFSTNGTMLNKTETRDTTYGGLAATDTKLYGPDTDGTLSTILAVPQVTPPSPAVPQVTASGPATVAPGTQFTVYYTVENTGAVASAMAVTADPLPSGVTVERFSGVRASTPDRSPPEATLDQIAAGGSSTFSITYAVDQAVSGDRTVGVTIEEPDAGNSDSTSSTVTVSNLTGLARFDPDNDGIGSLDVARAINAFENNEPIGGEPVGSLELAEVINRFESGS